MHITNYFCISTTQNHLPSSFESTFLTLVKSYASDGCTERVEPATAILTSLKTPNRAEDFCLIATHGTV